MARRRLALFVAAGLAVALALAFFLGPEASSQPDGLNRVAIDQGFADEEAGHRLDDSPLDDSPLAGYQVKGVDGDRLSTGLAGAIGVTVTFVLAGGLFLVLRRRRTTE